MNTPDLGTVITSATARRAIYGVYVIAVVIIGAIQVGFSAIDGGQPDWVTVAVQVAAYLAIPVGALALVNTTSKDAVIAELAPLTPAEQDAGIRAAASRIG